MGVDDDVAKIVRQWANMSRNPRGNDVLHALWAASGPNGGPPAGEWDDAAQDLASQINAKFPDTGLNGPDFTPPGAIDTVEKLDEEV